MENLTVNGQSVESSVLPTSVGRGGFYLYAVHVKHGAAYRRTSYRHTQTAEYETAILPWGGKELCIVGNSPRANGITKSNGWSIEEDI
jgi:hypothetical protein